MKSFDKHLIVKILNYQHSEIDLLSAYAKLIKQYFMCIRMVSLKRFKEKKFVKLSNF